MKIIKFLTFFMALLAISSADAQILKKLGKRAERAAERAVERRVERETEKSTDRALDSVIDAPKKAKKKKKKKAKKSGKSKGGEVIGSSETSTPSDAQNYEVSSNFDFEPGGSPIFMDNFERDLQGDFPSNWDANGTGEIVMINGDKWFRLGNKTTFLPMVEQDLPENYTIEFDLLTQGIDKKTSSQAMITLFLDDSFGFKKGKNWSMVELTPCQFIESQGAIEKVENGSRVMRNQVGRDYRPAMNNKKSRISIAVNKSRMRVWINENKIVDVPRLVAMNANKFKISTRSLRDARNLDEVYVANFRIAKAGIDNRSKLLTEGRLSTNSILFDTGTAKVKDPNNPVIKEVADALKSVATIKIVITGHTDSDGEADTNMTLSRERADAVKEILVKNYGIDKRRVFTDGMGEESPVADNGTSDGKAKNRRVEFKRL